MKLLSKILLILIAILLITPSLASARIYSIERSSYEYTRMQYYNSYSSNYDYNYRPYYSNSFYSGGYNRYSNTYGYSYNRDQNWKYAVLNHFERTSYRR